MLDRSDPRTAPARLHRRLAAVLLLLLLPALSAAPVAEAQSTNKPVLHGKDWIAITGKPLGATAGAEIFQAGGNAVDAACAMLAVTSTMWDVLSWGGETQALVHNPETGEVVGVNALGIAPTGATPEFFRERGLRHPPAYGPLAAVTPGTPGGLLTMLAEWGELSLAEVLDPAIRMAEEGYPIEAQTANSIERSKERIKEWTYSPEVYLPHLGDEEREAPHPGEIFRQPDLAETLRKLVEAEREALDAGATREEAIHAAYDRFYRGDIAEEFVRGAQEEGGLITMEDLDRWEVRLEEPVSTTYDDIEVFKLTTWTQGPAMLQALNMLEPMDLEAMGYNSARYVHALYQVMNRAFADRDFYYGDPYYPPEEPVEGLLSKEYARDRIASIDWERNDPDVRPGDPYRYQDGENPFTDHLEGWRTDTIFAPAATLDGSGRDASAAPDAGPGALPGMTREEAFHAGTTSVQAADAEGWIVSITPSGGWVPAVIAGRTGVGMSQRMQSFVTDPAENPYNVVEPGKRPRATLTPGMALRDGRPFLSFAVQGGDTQDQNLLQFFLNMVEWEMNVQQAAEAANIASYQLRGSFGDHESTPGRLVVRDDTSPWVVDRLEAMGYDVGTRSRTSGPINAVFFDLEHGTFWGGSSDYGEDYGIAW